MHDLQFKLDNEKRKYTFLVKKHEQEIHKRDQRESDFQEQINLLKRKIEKLEKDLGIPTREYEAVTNERLYLANRASEVTNVKHSSPILISDNEDQYDE